MPDRFNFLLLASPHRVRQVTAPGPPGLPAPEKTSPAPPWLRRLHGTCDRPVARHLPAPRAGDRLLYQVLACPPKRPPSTHPDRPLSWNSISAADQQIPSLPPGPENLCRNRNRHRSRLLRISRRNPPNDPTQSTYPPQSILDIGYKFPVHFSPSRPAMNRAPLSFSIVAP